MNGPVTVLSCMDMAVFTVQNSRISRLLLLILGSGIQFGFLVTLHFVSSFEAGNGYMTVHVKVEEMVVGRWVSSCCSNTTLGSIILTCCGD